MPTSLARALSILGHPLLVLPAAVMVLAANAGGRATRLAPFALALGGVAAAVMGYSAWQVRRRRWAHVDASARGERRDLNRFLLVLLAASAATAWLWSSQREFALGLALSALLVAAASLSARWCKLSLHVAFAAYAAVLLVQLSWSACIAGLAFAFAVAWSRLVLGRHALRDLLAGGAAGLVAGLAFRQLLTIVA